jgi:hypothetical protein
MIVIWRVQDRFYELGLGFGVRFSIQPVFMGHPHLQLLISLVEMLSWKRSWDTSRRR